MPFVVEVERVIKVTGGALAPGKQWLITSTEMIDGVDFVALEKKALALPDLWSATLTRGFGISPFSPTFGTSATMQ